MAEVEVNAVITNEYTNDYRLIIRDSQGTKMSMYRFFQLALEPPSGGSTWCGHPPYYWGGYSGHLGYDFPATQGTTIRSTCYGTVWRTSNEVSSGSMGNYVCVKEVKPDNTFRIHTYMHMVSAPPVHTGDIVQQGTLIGYVGNTGASEGNHVHYECMTDESFSNKIDAWAQFDNSTQPVGWTPQVISNHISGDVCSWEWIEDTNGIDCNPSGGGGGGGGTTISSLTITLKLNPPPEIMFKLPYPIVSTQPSYDNYLRVNPGYFKPTETYGSYSNLLALKTYDAGDLKKTPIEITWKNSSQVTEKPVIKYTTDGSDPIEYGITQVHTEEGGVIINDYEGSINMAPILTDYSWPMNLRAVLVDADSPDTPITMASAVFTHDTDKTEQEQLDAVAEYQEFLVAYNAIGDVTSDNHAYLVVNDDSIADLTDYIEPAI